MDARDVVVDLTAESDDLDALVAPCPTGIGTGRPPRPGGPSRIRSPTLPGPTGPP